MSSSWWGELSPALIMSTSAVDGLSPTYSLTVVFGPSRGEGRDEGQDGGESGGGGYGLAAPHPLPRQHFDGRY